MSDDVNGPDRTGPDASDPRAGASLDRLRSADPAGADPDPDVLRARIEAAIEADPGAGATVHPLRRRLPMVLGAAAGVALLAGATLGGVALGRMSAPDPVAAIPEVETSTGFVARGNAGGAGPQILGGTPAGGVASEMTIADERLAIWPGAGGGTEFTPAPGLSDESGTATGYRLRSAGIDIDALAQRLENVFGAKRDASDGMTPSVWVSDDALVSWSFSDPTKDPWACGVIEPMPEPMPAPADGEVPSESDVGSGVESGAGSTPGSPGMAADCPDGAGAPLGERAAIAESERILERLGVEDVDGIGIEWEAFADEYTTQVTGWQTVDGLRTELTWSFTFGGSGLVWANGFAAGLEAIPDLPVVGARTAVLRSITPRWNAFGPFPVGGGMVYPMAADTVASEPQPRTDPGDEPGDEPVDQPGDQPAARPSPGMSIELWWNRLTVTSAEPTLAQYWQMDGALLILPAYLITTDEDEGTWSVISVAESAVTFTTG